MKLVFHVGHPAHFHLFKNSINLLSENGNTVLITYTKKEMVEKLLSSSRFNNICIGSNVKGIFNKAFNLFKVNAKLYKVCKTFRPDAIISVANPYCTHVGKLLNIPTIIYDDTDHKNIEFYLFKYFADRIYTPFNFNHNLGPNHKRHNSLHEMAYLHPNYFTPNIDIYKKLGIDEGQKYAIIRFVSWDALHDIGYGGVGNEEKEKIISFFQSKMKVVISSEVSLPSKFNKLKISIGPNDIHSLIYFSSFFVGEGASMAAESAVLGVPSIYTNELRLCYIDTLEKDYSLIKTANTFEDIKSKFLEFSHIDSKANSKKLIHDKKDFTKIILENIEELIVSKNN